MRINTKEELKDLLIKDMPEELLANPAFASEWYWAVEYRFAENGPFDITVSNEEKKVLVVSENKVDRNLNIPQGTLNAYEFQINSRGEMEVTTSYGTLLDARAYYRETGKAPTSATSILDVSYRKKIYDINGIEQANCTFSKYNWGLSGINFESDLANQLRVQLLAEGWHKPKNWNVYINPELPTFVNDSTYVDGAIRNPENPSLVQVYSYQVNGFYRQPTERESYLAEIHGEYPERIRVDNYNKFAKFKDGKWVLHENFVDQFKGQSLEEVIRDISLLNEELLNDKKNMVRSQLQAYQYEILYQQVAKYNQRYQNDLSAENGRHM